MDKRAAVFCWVLVVCVSCKRPGQNAEGKEGDLVKADTAEMVFEMPTTAMRTEPLRGMPVPFRLDSFFSADTVRHFTEDVWYPTSAGVHKAFDDAVVMKAMGAASGSTPFPDEAVDAYESQTWVSSLSVNGNIVSVCFTWQAYTEGAAHFTHGYSTFNFDLKGNREVFFTDLFAFGSREEKETFCEQFSAENSDAQPVPEDLGKGLKFTLSDSILSIYFDDFEKGPSMCVAEAKWGDVKRYVKAGVEQGYGVK